MLGELELTPRCDSICLHQAVGAYSSITVKVTFSISDLNNWEAVVGTYWADPEKMAKAFETIVKTQDPDWRDIDTMLEMLLDGTEREMLKPVGGLWKSKLCLVICWVHWTLIFALQIPSGMLMGPCLERRNSYQQWILYWIRHAMPKLSISQNYLKFSMIARNHPTEFLSHLKEMVQKCMHRRRRGKNSISHQDCGAILRWY